MISHRIQRNYFNSSQKNHHLFHLNIDLFKFKLESLLWQVIFLSMCLGLIPGLLTPLCRRFLISATAQGLSVVSLALLIKHPYRWERRGTTSHPIWSPVWASGTSWWASLCFRKPACMLSGGTGCGGLLTVQIQTKRACYFVVSTCITQMAGSSFGDQNMEVIQRSFFHFSPVEHRGDLSMQPREKMFCVNTALVNLLPSDSVVKCLIHLLMLTEVSVLLILSIDEPVETA